MIPFAPFLNRYVAACATIFLWPVSQCSSSSSITLESHWGRVEIHTRFILLTEVAPWSTDKQQRQNSMLKQWATDDLHLGPSLLYWSPLPRPKPPGIFEETFSSSRLRDASWSRKAWTPLIYWHFFSTAGCNNYLSTLPAIFTRSITVSLNRCRRKPHWWLKGKFW